jgi:curli biogenesis system outer membrane secretion channel CsgG
MDAYLRRGALGLTLVMSAMPALAADGSKVETCTRKLGVLAVAEPQAGWGYLQNYGLGSPAALLRTMVQQSGCFDVVERGVAMQNLQQERALAQSGELRQASNVGQGQMQAADFVMTPAVQVGSSTTGGVGGALLTRLSGTLGALAGSLKFKEASTSLLLADVRSSLQVAAAEGKASKTDFSVGGWGFGIPGGGGGYTSTPEGKMVAASLLDNYNKIVLAVRDQPQLIRTGSAAGEANAAASTAAEAPQAPGQMLTPRIANVKAYAEPSREGKVLATLQRGDELVATGEVKQGFVHVDAANFSGWVQRTLVMPATAAAPAAPAAAVGTGVGAGLAPGLTGAFSGEFTGPDSGRFTVTVTAQGLVVGQGSSAAAGTFGITGRVDPAGGVLLAAEGQAGGALFTGRIDPGTGQVQGTWRLPRGQGGGTFTGRRG